MALRYIAAFMRRSNMELLKMIESIRTPFLDGVFGIITQFGEQNIGIVILCVIFWSISKRAAYIIGAVFFISGLTVQGAKILFRIDRPWIADPTFNPVPAAIGRATGYSFPSGHTQSAAAIFGSLGALIRSKPIAAVCFFIAILVAFSRMYLGVHTLIDVAVSLLITFAIVFAVVCLLRDEELYKKRAIAVSVVIVALAAVVTGLALWLYHNELIEQHNVADCFKAAGAAIGFALGMYIEREFIKFPIKAKNLAAQIVKCILGLIGVLALQEVLIWNLDPGLFSDMFRYFLLIIWVTVIYPFAIKRFFPEKEAE